MIKKTAPRYLIYAFLALTFAALACNLPGEDAVPEGVDVTIQNQLAETGNILVRSVAAASSEVVIEIDLPAGESEAALFSSWVIIFETALKSAPMTDQVVIKMYTLGEPYADLTAQSKDVVEFIGKKIDITTFFSRIEMVDHRPPEAGLRQALSSNHWMVTTVEITPERVYIEVLQPAVENKEDIVTGWFQMMDFAHTYAPDSQEVVLHLLNSEPPHLTVQSSMTNVSLFNYGEMDAASFLAALTIIDG